MTGLLLFLGVIVAAHALAFLQAQPTGPFQEKKGPAPQAPLPAPPAVFPPPSTPTNGPQPLPLPPDPPPLRFNIDPESKLSDLLPTPPKAIRSPGPLFGNDLSRVPEVQFEAPSDAVDALALKSIAHQMAKINHLNNKRNDGFIESLRNERADLLGLPFAMGEACRTKGERSKQFALAVATVRQALRPPSLQNPLPQPPPAVGTAPAIAPTAPGEPVPATAPSVPMSATPVNVNANSSGNTFAVTLTSFTPALASASPVSPDTFWEQYQTLCSQQDKQQAKARSQQRAMITLARIAALTQILMPMTEMHPGLVNYLAAVSDVEATHALARLALFSSEADARHAALDALKVRRGRDYTDILLHGLRYPWPAVARRAAEAIAKLERNDLLPQLIDVLEQPDPRAPVMRQVKDKRVPMVRELVLNKAKSPAFGRKDL